MAAWNDLLDVVSRDEVDALEGALDKMAAYTPGERGGLDAWGRLLALARIADRIQALMVRVAGHVHDTGVVEKEEDLPIEVALGLLAGMPVADRRTLLLAAETLSKMPEVERLFGEGSLSWGQVRGIVRATRRLTAEQREEVDRALAKRHADTTDRNADAEDLLIEVDRLVARLRPQDLERQEKRAYEGRFLSVQLGLDGTSRWYAEVDAPMTATMLEAVDTAVARHRQQGRGDLHADDEIREESQPRWKRRGRDRADALHDICDTYLAEGDTGPARPSMLLVADAETVRGGEEPGTLLWRSPYGPVALSAAEIRRLACESDVEIVLRDGATVVGLASADAKTTDEVRAMVVARDHHCRGPGCRAPIEVIHHVDFPDGATDVRRQAGLCRGDHHKVHHDGWDLEMTDDGTCTWRRGRRTFVTRPPDLRRLEPGDPPEAAGSPDAESDAEEDERSAAPTEPDVRRRRAGPSKDDVPF